MIEYWPKDHIWCGCPECGKCKCSICVQPERLNPEDEREKRELEFFRNNIGVLSEYLKNFKDPNPLTFVCDSLNTTNK